MTTILLPKIAIIGAGPAGLTLARLLHVSQVNIDLTLYELDASPTSRPNQGGTLDLHTDTGLAALRKCGLWDSFRKYARYEGDELIIVDKNATELVHKRGGEKESPYTRPEIDRERLKEILLESVPEEYVRWGWHLREVTKDGMLKFDGREEMEGPFDLIVGADGGWSKVRARLNGLKPAYSGVSGYEMEIKEPAKTCPHVDKMIGRGSYFSWSDQKFLDGQRMGNNSIKVRSWYLCPEAEAQETLDKYGKKETLEKILERHADWAPEMTEFFRQGDLDGLKHWTLYELPVGSKWEHKKGFTLIGDAASLMTPFAGEGVNKAMKDSLELAELIEKSQDPNNNLTLDQAVLLYEQQMFPRAERTQAKTMNNKENIFGPDAPIGVMTGMLKSVASDSPSILVKMLGTAPVVATVYGYFWIRMQIGWAVRRFWRKT
jgi:2-polyprenyl-6-methoxyphenol hydroxylase-like FAD-dependent oxidoreductase